MATLATQVVPNAGLQATYATAAVAGGDKCATGDGVFLHVRNGAGAPITVTLATPGTVDSLAVADRAVVVTNALEKFIPVPDLYRDPADGLCAITYSSPTSVTVAVLRVA